ncbi:MAG: hypothetical protein ABGX16_02000, partial [Pirellulales bacterium]
MNSTTLWRLYAASFLLLIPCDGLAADNLSLPLKAGIIGVDAHALSWTKILNDANAPGELADMVVVAAYAGGSPDIPQSMELLKKQEGPVAELGVEIVDSIDKLLSKVDVVMVLSIDGRAHLEQVRPVFASGKPVFILIGKMIFTLPRKIISRYGVYIKKNLAQLQRPRRPIAPMGAIG